jgi:cysteine protease ATG4
MEIPYFQGFIGGKPGKALYVLGKHLDRFIYLDPHMPQVAVTKSNFEK